MIKLKLFSGIYEIIVMFFIIVLFGCTETSDNNKQETKKIKLVEEIPNIYTEPDVTKNIGKINFDPNSGLPKSKITPLKALANLVKAKPKSEIITIYYTKYFTSDYHKDWKVVYNRIEKKVYNISISSNIKDVYENITDDVIISAANDKKCSTLYCLTTYSKSKRRTDFSKRKIDAVGIQPTQSELDGSVKVVEEFIKAKSKDASSIKFIEWSKVSPFGEFWVVRCKFQGVNSFGAVVTQNVWFYIQNNKVIKTKDIKK